ncbi:hypothetical protein [Acinetobacter baumannii]|uniref:hypothetical protein n=1 Tax=Acinetobacter baumannii TaxID=470 RepID=UPI00244D10CD|nr:hypothetical protein [Acinetobacter baumannii]MDH2594498.1 hypothetical protein [Acinetobacter baumannii]
MSNDLNRELSKLKDFVFQNYDPVGVSGKAMEIYNDYALQLSTFASEKLMILVAMDMGEEFELSKDEVESLLDALLLDSSLSSSNK